MRATLTIPPPQVRSLSGTQFKNADQDKMRVQFEFLSFCLKQVSCLGCAAPASSPLLYSRFVSC